MPDGGNAVAKIEELDEEVEATMEDVATSDSGDSLNSGATEELTEQEKLKAAYALDLEHVRMVEALLFAAAEPLDERTLVDRLPDGVYVPTVLERLVKDYEGRGVQLMHTANKWTFRTSPDLSYLMEKERVEQRRLSRAAVETLAIIAYHQPVTRAEIEAIRGVSVSKGTIDVLMEIEWVRMRGRRRVPGRPVLYGTTEGFLEHFGLENIKDLPGMDELKAAGLLDARLPPGFIVPTPDDSPDEVDEEDEDEDSEELFSGDLSMPFDGDEDEMPH